MDGSGELGNNLVDLVKAKKLMGTTGTPRLATPRTTTEDPAPSSKEIVEKNTFKPVQDSSFGRSSTEILGVPEPQTVTKNS